MKPMAQLALRQGLAFHESGRLADAIACYRKALSVGGDHAEIHHPLAVALFQAGDVADSDAHFRRALALDRRNPAVPFDYANALRVRGLREEAVARFKEALARDRGFEPARRNLALLLLETGRPEDAVPHLTTLADRHPGDADLRLSLASACRLAGRTAEAVAHLQRLGRSGAALMEMALCRRATAPAMAADLFAESLKMPGSHHAAALMGIGGIMAENHNYVEAEKAYSAAAAVQPEDELLAAKVLEVRRFLADWRDFDGLAGRVRRGVEAGKPIAPLVVASLFDDPALLRRAAANWAPPGLAVAPPRPDRGDRIRVAYVSSDFRDHATTRLMAEVLELHDRSRFEIHLVCHSRDDGSEMRRRVLAAADRVSLVGAIGDAEVARGMRDAGIHVAVDLKGYTAESRTAIFAHRPAPIQVNWLGYPGTLAAPYMDVMLADPVVVPPGAEEAIDERVVRLPCYQPNDRRRPRPARVPRAAFGLPEDAVVLCCLNATSKVTPQRLAAWADVLRQVPEAVIWLFEAGPEPSANLRKAFSDLGVDRTRVFFAPSAPYADYLAYYTAADLFLDTFPYCAHTTASDALWCGCPVLTQAGRSFHARVAASLLNSVGLTELVTSSSDDYVRAAVALARDPERLRRLRAGLESRREDLPLFDSASFTRSLEQVYAALAEEWFTATQ